MRRIHESWVAAALALWLCGAPAHAAERCVAQLLCTEASSFTSTVTDFRTSTSGYYRLATATLRLKNKSDQALALGYVQGSGVVIDDLGNRYGIDSRDANNVRAIGVITPTSYDPKFTLQPGESGDARFQFSWYAGNKPAGTTFQLELTIREIEAAPGNRMKLAREHVVQLRALTDGIVAPPTQAVAAAAATAPSAASVAAAAPPPQADPCAAQQRCYNAGAFTAQVAQLTVSQASGNHLVRLNVKFRNNTAQPLILAYTKNSGAMVDEHGNRYVIAARADRVKGIGVVEPGRADPQFVLNPGEMRAATFEYSRYLGRTLVGSVFTPDLAIEQLEVLPSRQVRSIREYSINYSNLTAGAMVGDASDTLDAINDVSEAGRQLSEGLKSLFKKK